jgi:hypothetical protein
MQEKLKDGIRLVEAEQAYPSMRSAEVVMA